MNFPRLFLFLIPFLLLLSPYNIQAQAISIDEDFSDWEDVLSSDFYYNTPKTDWQAEKYVGNPIIESGGQFYPPGVVHYEGEYYLAAKSFGKIKLFKSKNGVTEWNDLGTIFQTSDINWDTGSKLEGTRFVYNPERDEFWLINGFRHNGSNTNGEQSVSIAVSKNPEGPYRDIDSPLIDAFSNDSGFNHFESPDVVRKDDKYYWFCNAQNLLDGTSGSIILLESSVEDPFNLVHTKNLFSPSQIDSLLDRPVETLQGPVVFFHNGFYSMVFTAGRSGAAINGERELWITHSKSLFGFDDLSLLQNEKPFLEVGDSTSWEGRRAYFSDVLKHSDGYWLTPIEKNNKLQVYYSGHSIEDSINVGVTGLVEYNLRANAEPGDIDFTDFKITNDDRFIYLYLEVDSEILLQQFHDITLLIDTDNDPETGEAFSGIGYELRFNLGQRDGDVNLSGQTSINSYDIGLVSAPTVTSNRFEIKINRDAEVNGTPIFSSDSINLLFRSQSSGGDIVPDSPSDFSYKFNDNVYVPTTYTLEKHNANDLRFMTYNVLRDNLFEPNLKENFERIFKAIQPDIIGLEEVYNHSGEEAANLIQEFLGGEWFHGDVDNDNLIASRYPIIGQTAIGANAAYLLDLDQFHVFVIVAHPPCCTNDDGRQDEIDAFMAFLRDSKSGSGFDLEEQTPIVIMGDMNLVGLNRQVKTLLEGDIENESVYGEDFSPDWDSTPLEDAKPANPGLPTTFTWYSENSAFSAGRLDYIVYSGSVFELGNNFSLHTKTLPQDTLDSFSLERDDTINASDHLPLVADFRLLPITSTSPVPDIPNEAKLNQNYPNPFNPTTEISFALPNLGFVSLEVFDMGGRKVTTLVNEFKSEGLHAARWNANSAASGIYIYRLTTVGQVITRKMVLIK